VSDGGIDWSRVSRGLYLAGFGTFLLLTTQGLLPWSMWREALAWWPVLMVALGVRLSFERSRAPWAVLISPLLVLGTLAGVTLKGPATGPREWAPLRAARPQGADRWTLEGTMAMASLEVTARPLAGDLLVEGRAAPGGRATVEVAGRPSDARVRVRNRGRGWPFLVLPGRAQACDLVLSRDLPLALDLELAFADGRLDLASAPVSRLDLHGAFTDLTLRLGAPEADVRLDFSGAFNSVRLEVPPSTPVRVSKSGFLNFVDGRPEARSLTGPGYRLGLEGAFNRVVIRPD
jgi:hypothetical protein